jgi:E3 ubiquitin-protein ligase RAD18
MLSTWLKVRPEVLQVVQKAEEKPAMAIRSKRKLDGEEAVDSRYPKRQTRKSSRRTTSPTDSSQIIILDSEDECDVEYVPDAVSSSMNDGLVACPICGVRMKEELVFQHLDRCQPPALPKDKPM